MELPALVFSIDPVIRAYRRADAELDERTLRKYRRGVMPDRAGPPELDRLLGRFSIRDLADLELVVDDVAERPQPGRRRLRRECERDGVPLRRARIVAPDRRPGADGHVVQLGGTHGDSRRCEQANEEHGEARNPNTTHTPSRRPLPTSTGRPARARSGSWRATETTERHPTKVFNLRCVRVRRRTPIDNLDALISIYQ